MAVASYTQQILQDKIHVLVENDPNTPSTSDDEWAIRYQLIKQAVNNWESEDVFWNELWKRYTHATPVTAGTTTYSITATAPDFNSPGSYIKFTDANGSSQYLQVVKPEEMTRFQDNAYRVYFTGNTGTGYTINLGWTPSAGDALTGTTMSFGYYSSASTPSGTSDTTWAPEMSNPDYITFWVAAQKHLMDGNTNQYNVYSQMADENMDKMKFFNEVKPINSDMRMDDVELAKDASFFGG